MSAPREPVPLGLLPIAVAGAAVVYGAVTIGLPLMLTIVVLLAAGWILFRRTAGSHDPVRRLYWRTKARMRPGPGFASWWEIQFHHSRWAAVRTGRRARPGMTFRARLFAPATAYAIRHGRAQWFRRIYSPAEEQAVILAPPRRGKTGILGDRIIDHPGPALVAESRSDAYYATMSSRPGPVEVFNPKNISGIPSTFRWAITAGCESPSEAILRATDMVGAIAEGEMQWWSEKSATALAAALHAAAVLGADMADVWSWSNGYLPQLITEGHKTPGASLELFGALTELDKPGKTADSIRLTMSKSLAWLAVPEIRNMVTGPDAKPFDVAEFVKSNSTVYLMSGGDGDPCAPLFRCFTSYVHRAAGLYGLSLPSRRLDPGLLIAIDELHACPVDLPSWLADSAGKGIQVVAVVHSTGQLEAKYGKAGLRTVMDTSGTKMFLPGIQDVRTLEDVSRLCGHKKDDRLLPNVPPEFLRMMPDGYALLLRANRPPVIVKFRPYWKRRDYRAVPEQITRPASEQVTSPAGNPELGDTAA